MVVLSRGAAATGVSGRRIAASFARRERIADTDQAAPKHSQQTPSQNQTSKITKLAAKPRRDSSCEEYQYGTTNTKDAEQQSRAHSQVSFLTSVSRGIAAICSQMNTLCRRSRC